MTEFSSRGTAAETRIQADDGRTTGVATPAEFSRDERIWTWLLRVVLPVILALCLQLISWMWFNNIYGLDAWSIAGGVLLAFVVVPIAIWTWHSWLPLDRELPATPGASRLQLRHVVLVLLAFAAVAGYASVSGGRDGVHGRTQLSSNV